MSDKKCTICSKKKFTSAFPFETYFNGKTFYYKKCLACKFVKIFPYPSKKDLDKYSKQLYVVNKKLWETEDILRALENEKSFNKEFIENARNVYKLNDERFRIKNKLNKQFSSEIIEEKSYKEYK